MSGKWMMNFRLIAKSPSSRGENKFPASRPFIFLLLFVLFSTLRGNSQTALIIRVGAIVNFGSPQPTNSVPVAPPSDILRFLDGSVLHGSLKLIDENHGVSWEHDAARKLTQIKP